MLEWLRWLTPSAIVCTTLHDIPKCSPVGNGRWSFVCPDCGRAWISAERKNRGYPRRKK